MGVGGEKIIRAVVGGGSIAPITPSDRQGRGAAHEISIGVGASCQGPTGKTTRRERPVLDQLRPGQIQRELQAFGRSIVQVGEPNICGGEALRQAAARRY